MTSPQFGADIGVGIESVSNQFTPFDPDPDTVEWLSDFHYPGEDGVGLFDYRGIPREFQIRLPF